MTTTTAPPFPWSTCTTVAEERRHRQERLAAAFRIMARHGLDEGLAGHLTVRDSGDATRFWVNPFPVPFARIRVSDLLVDERGAVVEGERDVNRSAFAIHASIHAARPDIDAAVHSHSRYGKAWSALGRLLDPITQDHCDFHGDHALYDDYRGRVLDPSEGGDIAAALGTTKAVILRNHGLLTLGHSIEEAVWWFLRLERCCEVQLLAEAAGAPVLIDDAAARQAHAEQGSPVAGWFTAQPLFDAVLADEPDLLA
ncbi:MAG TPA: class II aldolase/adducin family protein [Acidimicrobiales bacterium]|nr:class II aldolase/adducin family protein [Acidimicrobiales bacterium]